MKVTTNITLKYAPERRGEVEEQPAQPNNPLTLPNQTHIVVQSAFSVTSSIINIGLTDIFMSLFR